MTRKHSTLFWIWLMMLVAYMDRINIAVAGPTMMRALHIGVGEFGLVLAAFTLGYALMQAPGGYLADRFGARRLLVIALTIWSVFTALTGLAWSFVSLVAIRILFGFGEGIENGAQFKLIGDSFDSRERSSANALFLSALAVGPAIAAPASSWLIQVAGWRALFYCFAVVGLIVALLMYLFLPKPPQQVIHTAVKDASGQDPDWRELLSRQTTLLVIASYLLFNFAYWGLNGWMPTYLTMERHIDLKHLGLASMTPYAGGFAGLLILGHLGSGAFLKRRALLVGASYLLAAVSLFLAYTANSPALAVAGLTSAAFFLYGGFGPLWAIALDLAPDKLRGAFSGVVNFGGQVGGFTAPIAIGEVVAKTHVFAGGFGAMIGALVVSAISLAVLQVKLNRSVPLERAAA